MVHERYRHTDRSATDGTSIAYSERELTNVNVSSRSLKIT